MGILDSLRFRPGQRRISASDLNSIIEEIRRIPRPAPAPPGKTWLGITVAEGPFKQNPDGTWVPDGEGGWEHESDYGDCRYWVVPARLADESSDPTSKVIYEQVRRDFFLLMPAPPLGQGPLNPDYRIVTATNLSELQMDSHTLVPGSLVLVEEVRSVQSPPTTKYQLLPSGGGGGSGTLAVVTGFTYDSFGNTYITAKKRTNSQYGYEDGEEVQAFGGYNPMLTTGCEVVVIPTTPIPDAPNITAAAIPLKSIDPTRLIEPQPPCAVTIGNSCNAPPAGILAVGMHAV